MDKSIFAPIEEVIAAVAAGRMVILMDDEARENEGDLMIAAEHITPEAINFMAQYGRGLICLTLTEQRCKTLRLPLMMPHSGGTNFTVSIDAAKHISTGISAADRAHTVRVALADTTTPDDLIQPGHIFPLMARPGGVLTRAGHTEAGCDIARLAGCKPAAVIVEVLNHDGTMARRDDLVRFAAEHNTPLGTIADLIRYRMATEHTVEAVTACDWPTRYGDFRLHTYRDGISGVTHLAMLRGTPATARHTYVRVHVMDTLADLCAASTARQAWPLPDALACLGALSSDDAGVVVLLRNETDKQLCERIDRGGSSDSDSDDALTYGTGARILSDLGVTTMTVLGTTRRMDALSGFGLTVDRYIEWQPQIVSEQGMPWKR